MAPAAQAGQPVFAKPYLSAFTGHMTAATADALHSGPLVPEASGRTRLNRAMMELTLDVVGRALFGADLTGETAARVGPAMNHALKLGTEDGPPAADVCCFDAAGHEPRASDSAQSRGAALPELSQ